MSDRELLELAKNVIKEDSDWQPTQATWEYYQALKDPQVVVDLLEKNAKLMECINLIIAEIPHARQPRKEGNAPGHCHEVPGVWDSDNGAKAGKECGWCKTWNLALSLS